MLQRGVAGAERGRFGRGGRLAPLGAALALAAAPAQGQSFGRVSVTPDFELNGAGTNVDTIAFWEAPDPADTLMFVSAKGNQRVEVWRFPFLGNEQPALVHPSFGTTGTRVNGLAVDPATNRLYVSVSAPQSTVSVFTLPELAFQTQFIAGSLDLKGEPNLALLHHPIGATWLYVSADTTVYVRDATTGAAVTQFTPSKGLETMVADERDLVIYIPDENGRTGIYAYTPLGLHYLRQGTNQFGTGVFDSDGEGILLYRCMAGASDTGRGWIVAADQRLDHTDFEFFDRRTWEHLGTLELAGVSNTDGIASTQRALPGWPRGVFAAIDDDTATAVVGWHRIFAATGLACPFVPEAPALSPAALGVLAVLLAATGPIALRAQRGAEARRDPRGVAQRPAAAACGSRLRWPIARR